MLLKRWHAGRLSQTYPDVTWNNRIYPNGIEKSAAPFGAALAEFIVGAVALVIVEAFPLQIAMLFGAANESAYYADFTVKCFRTYLCLMPLATLNKGTFIYLQALGKAFASTAVSMTREIIFGVSLPVILPVFFGLDGLLWSFPAADLLTFLIAVFFIRQTYRELSDVSAVHTEEET